MRAFRIFTYLISSEIFAGLLAAVVFRVLPVAQAGFLAGSAFTAVGVFGYWAMLKHAVWRRRVCLWVAGLYLFVFALPLWLTRLFTPGGEALQSVVGLPLEFFHRGSETAFAFLFLCTFMQMLFTFPRAPK